MAGGGRESMFPCKAFRAAESPRARCKTRDWGVLSLVTAVITTEQVMFFSSSLLRIVLSGLSAKSWFVPIT